MKFCITFFLFFIFFISKAQQSDTIYVYYEEVVHDTVYIDKKKKEEPRKKIKPYIVNTYRNQVTQKSSDFGLSVFLGNKNLSIFDFLSTRKSFSGGAGIWFEQKYSFPQTVSLKAGLNFFHWPRTYELGKDSELSGIYFTENNEPLLFQNFSNKHSEFSLPVTVGYSFGNFTPFLGAALGYSTFRMEFIFSQNNSFGSPQEFKARNFSIGYVAGLKYSIGRFHLLAEFYQSQYSQLKFKNENTSPFIFKVKNGITDQKILFGVQYSLKPEP